MVAHTFVTSSNLPASAAVVTHRAAVLLGTWVVSMRYTKRGHGAKAAVISNPSKSQPDSAFKLLSQGWRNGHWEAHVGSEFSSHGERSLLQGHSWPLGLLQQSAEHCLACEGAEGRRREEAREISFLGLPSGVDEEPCDSFVHS